MPLDPSEQRLKEGSPLGGGGGLTADSVGNTEVDNAADFTWTGRHDWQADSADGLTVLREITDTSTGNSARWVLTGAGAVELRTDARTLYTVALGTGAYFTFPEQANMLGGGRVDDTFLDFGASDDMRVEYQSTDDAYVIRDQTNGLDRLQVDRTTGDTSIEGALTEGATL